MTNRNAVIVYVTEHWQVARAERAAKELAQSLGLPQAAVYRLATSVSELACNLFFHARHGGTITLRAVTHNARAVVEIIAEDDGPGIPDVHSAMRDNFTTNGGLGGGLPGVERLMEEFHIVSRVGVGTRVVARMWGRCS